jgi:cold shock CspA family protein
VGHRVHDVSVLSIGARPRAGQQKLPPHDSRATERGARAENITTSIIERPGAAAAATGTSQPRVVLRRADDDLWVATSNGEYAGLVTQLSDGFHVYDRYTRPVRVVAALEHASWLLAAPHGLDARRRAQPHEPLRLTRRSNRTRARGPAVSTREDIMATGTVKWFNAEKGFGFIAPSDGTGDVFAHYSEISSSGYRSLEENQSVAYDVAQGPKGPQATNIRAL